ncbi:hypothetical protein [Roseobacter sp. HKCCA0434]|uniref:hypothetical protein n=1 Tax=Roseobacter sp. HKCCA0434 TaxID=3079297 RepID=UPI002905E79A|nr:hypothetical protein [Roseobacter sp. HKCCA0434]
MGIAALVDWYGPYKSFKRLKREAGYLDSERCLYMAIEKAAGFRKVVYVGLTISPGTRFNNQHTLNHNAADEYYLGELTTTGVPGRRLKGNRPKDLDAAERALISYLKPKFNVHHVNSVPSECCAVVSRFFGRNNWQKPKPTPDFMPWAISYNEWSEGWASAYNP